MEQDLDDLDLVEGVKHCLDVVGSLLNAFEESVGGGEAGGKLKSLSELSSDIRLGKTSVLHALDKTEPESLEVGGIDLEIATDLDLLGLSADEEVLVVESTVVESAIVVEHTNETRAIASLHLLLLSENLSVEEFVGVGLNILNQTK